jgi:hypothetical protein
VVTLIFVCIPTWKVGTRKKLHFRFKFWTIKGDEMEMFDKPSGMREKFVWLNMILSVLYMFMVVSVNFDNFNKTDVFIAVSPNDQAVFVVDRDMLLIDYQTIGSKITDFIPTKIDNFLYELLAFFYLRSFLFMIWISAMYLKIDDFSEDMIKGNIIFFWVYAIATISVLPASFDLLQYAIWMAGFAIEYAILYPLVKWSNLVKIFEGIR